MDAFAVSICKGLSVRKVRPAHLVQTGVWFGGFQALMPVLGYFLGITFADFVASVDHWIAFILLGIIGGNMIKESRESDVEELDDDRRLQELARIMSGSITDTALSAAQELRARAEEE